ncbi:ribbon-helix-helix domain-containing protein [Sphingobium sp. Ant17]|uniref:ribbon-helix-helix domain-containing protein n=1 Tax=Sphingobium sp. Ant17 TaxID=1461752 RepID=UPI00044C12AE|nr:ribbon-helix-helix domain-containing protein [Sphingobium sp. Ant17]EXS70085.1 arylsulfate sulfotransferase [Sphingobium sp. Ant17]MDE0945467.1 ribbon-helix-helix domain-containing protein [Sphingobium sp.]|tara:strand:+ start:18066 stop:18359 length:294 start_codon:yes stop_codon:yes gene_type:complete
MNKGDPVDGPDGPMGSPFAPPVKRSVTIAGHQTAISLEPIFWDALRLAAQRTQLPINALIAQIDVMRMAAADPPNLASAIRCWLFAAARPIDNNHSQ